jgi:hypothetical protein
MLRFFNMKYLAVLIIAVVAVAAIGNAALLTITPTPNVVQGESGAFAPETLGLAYTIGATGDVTATLTFADSFDVVSFSHDGTAYVACTGATTSWDCVMTKTEAQASTGIDVVAATND